LAIRQRELGELHADVAASLINLGTLRSVTGWPDSAAIPLLRRAVGIRTRLFGPNDPRTTDAMYALAGSLHETGNYRDAQLEFERWLAIVESQPPQLTPARANQLTDVLTVVRLGGQPERAERLAREIVALNRALYGDEHSRVANALVVLGGILSNRTPREAETILRHAIALLRASYPDGHMELVNGLVGLGFLLNDQQRWAEAESTWREVAAMSRRVSESEGLTYANAIAEIGHVQVARKEYVAAERTLRSVMRLAGIQRHPTNPVSIRAGTYLGEALRGQGRLAEAEPLLLAGYNIQSVLSRRIRPFAAEALVRLYEAEQRPEDAAKYRPATAP
jgi:tetratricopeptide (TPR) repeat protein